jgi:hypothetical protein
MKLEQLKSFNIITELFRIRDIAHVIHLDTTSYAEHKALNSFYDEWLGLSDQFIESYQGKYTRIKVDVSEIIRLNINNSSALLAQASTTINLIRSRVKDDSELNNILDEMQDLVNTTKYLLTLK